MTAEPDAVTAASTKIIDLRALLARNFPATALARAPVARLPTGVEFLDKPLEGGLPKAALTELVASWHGSGSGLIIQSLIAAARAAGQHLALVDANDSFSPDGLTNDELSALLWVRCAGPEQAIKAADLLCRDNNLPFIILDLMMSSARQVRAIASTYWYRLQRVAKGNGAVALVLTPVSVVGSAANTLRLKHRFDLSALDLLRDELIARLEMDVVRTRATHWPELEMEMPQTLKIG